MATTTTLHVLLAHADTTALPVAKARVHLVTQCSFHSSSLLWGEVLRNIGVNLALPDVDDMRDGRLPTTRVFRLPSCSVPLDASFQGDVDLTGAVDLGACAAQTLHDLNLHPAAALVILPSPSTRL